MRENLLQALLEDPERNAPRGTVSRTSREQYIARVTAGGMPVPLTRPPISPWVNGQTVSRCSRPVSDCAASGNAS